MEIKRFGNPVEKKIMMLHGNLMCWRQFEDVIPLLEEEFDVYAVSFDGFDGTGKTTYTTAQEQADKLENGDISKEEYDEWRYKYPELDTYQKRAKVPSQELSDYLVKELTKKEK